MTIEIDLGDEVVDTYGGDFTWESSRAVFDITNM